MDGGKGKLRPSQIFKEAKNIYQEIQDWPKVLGIEIRLIVPNLKTCEYSSVGEAYLWSKFEWYNQVKAKQGQQQADQIVAPVTMIKLAKDYNLTAKEYEALAQIEMILIKKHPAMFCTQPELVQCLVKQIDEIRPEHSAIQFFEIIWNNWFVEDLNESNCSASKMSEETKDNLQPSHDPSGPMSLDRLEMVVSEATKSASEISEHDTKCVFSAFAKFWEALVKFKLRMAVNSERSSEIKASSIPQETTKQG